MVWGGNSAEIHTILEGEKQVIVPKKKQREKEKEVLRLRYLCTPFSFFILLAMKNENMAR